MEKWKLPPPAKIYEAMSAVADCRVKLVGETAAEVVSSSGDKTYQVRWSAGFGRITSDDNASRWQGYLGYPIVAVLLASGRLELNRNIAGHLTGIRWKDVNRRFRNDYGRAVDSVLAELEKKGTDVLAIRAEAEKIMAGLAGLGLEKLKAAGKGRA